MVYRWRFEDPADANPATRTYTFAISPDTMSSPFGTRSVTFEGTTAVDGQPIMWETQMPPTQFTFGGQILDDAHYEQLRAWTYDRQGRLFLYDHFGRRMIVTLTKFDPTPKRAIGRYWRHTYTITAFVYAITAPTVGLGQ